MGRAQAQARDIIWTVWNEMYKNNLLPITNAGTPTDGTSGTGVGLRGRGGKGALCYDTTNGYLFQNEGEKDDPVWGFVGTQVS